jgi:hypothetical protein
MRETPEKTKTKSDIPRNMDNKIINDEKENNDGWSVVIRPLESLFSIDFQEIWRYRDLCAMFV